MELSSQAPSRREPRLRGGGFIGMTRVWTQNGRVAMRDIDVGHTVASTAPGGDHGTVARVVRTTHLDDMPISYVRFIDRELRDSHGFYKACVVWTSDHHPFWVIGHGWIAAVELKAGYRVLLLDGRTVEVTISTPCHATEHANTVWQRSGFIDERGTLVDLTDVPRITDDMVEPDRDDILPTRFLTTLHDIEVEAAHAYHVGAWGVRVQDAG